MTRTLMYHDVAKASERETVGFTGTLAARYKLDPTTFEAHLDAIHGTGTEIGVVDAASLSANSAPAAVISFDDGGASAMRAADLLELRGWRGQFFVTTGRIGSPGFLSVSQIRELAARGHAIGSHSHSHPTYMGRLSRGELDDEWTRSREILAGVLGQPPPTASVPGGYLARAVVESAAAAGFRVLFTSEPTARVSHQVIAVRGRYTIWASTPARTASAYVSGSPLACGRLWLEWNAKKLAKSASPGAYQTLRGVRARL